MLKRLALVGLLALLGCAVDSQEVAPLDFDVAAAPLVQRENVINAPASVADAAIVEATRLRFPKSAKSKLGDLAVGSVITGLPKRKDRLHSTNPDGFLRRVTKIETTDTELVLTTEQATLPELFKGGSIDADLVGAKPETSGELHTKTLEGGFDATFDQDIPSFGFDIAEVLPKDAAPGTAKTSGSIKVDGGKLTITPKAHIKTDFNILAITYFEAEIGLTYSASATVTAQATLSVARPIKLDGKELKKEIVPERVLAAGIIPGTPIPFTVKASVVASCTWQTAAAVKVTAKLSLKGDPSLKVIYDPPKGGWRYEGNPVNVVPEATGTMDVEGQLDVTCSIAPKIGLYFFGVAGPYVTGGPSLSFAAQAGTDCPPPGVHLTLTPGFKAAFGAEVSLFGLVSLDRKAWEENMLGTPFFEAGRACGKAGAAEPCVGKESGYYCGEDISGDPGTQYSCIEGKTTDKLPCPSKCDMQGMTDGSKTLCL